MLARLPYQELNARKLMNFKFLVNSTQRKLDLVLINRSFGVTYFGALHQLSAD